MGDTKSEANSTKRMFLRSTSAVPRRSNGSSNLAFSRAKSMQDVQAFNQKRSSRSSFLLLEDLVQCGICLDKLSEPRMLPCQHTFCLNCLQAHLMAITGRKIRKNHMPPSKEEIQTAVTETNNEIACPTCQKPISVGKGIEGLQQLPNNVYIDSLLKLLEDTSESLLQTPTSLTSETRCIKCQTICEFKEERCDHCKQIFCKVCWAEHLLTLKNNLFTLIENLRESEVRLEHRLHDFYERCNTVGMNIQKVTDEMIADIKVKEIESLNQLQNIKQQEEDSARMLKEHLTSTKKEIQLLSFDSIPNDKQKVEVFMNFHRTTSKLLNEISQMGETRLLFDPKTFRVKQFNEFFNRSTGEDGDVVDGGVIANSLDSIETMTSYYLNRTYNPKLVWTKCPRPAGLGIPPWSKNLLYITATDRKVVLILDRTLFKIVGKLTAPDMLCTQSITFSEKLLEIYVSDKWKHCIHVFSNEGDYLRSLCTLGSGHGELRSPEGIAINDNNHLVVADVGNDRVIVLDPLDGQHRLTLGMHNNRTELQAPTGVVAYKDRIIIADNGNHRIKVFSDIGKKLFEFGCLGSGKGQFRTAEVVTCDPLGFILVGDAGNGRIQVFTPNGDFVRVIGSYGEAPGKFAWISGLLVTPQLEIIATDYKNKRLQMF